MTAVLLVLLATLAVAAVYILVDAALGYGVRRFGTPRLFRPPSKGASHVATPTVSSLRRAQLDTSLRCRTRLSDVSRVSHGQPRVAGRGPS